MPAPDPVSSDAALPARTDVVIIGGGIIGAATALELAERGHEVVVLEKGEIAAEQSSRNWGWCRQMNRDPREIPLIVESLRLWRTMDERVEAETGFRQCGILYLAQSEEELESKLRWYEENARPYGLSSRPVSGAEAEEFQPGAAVKWTGGLYAPDDGRAEPTKAAPAMVEAARRKGAKVFTRCAARGLETSGGRVSAVVSERGRIDCSTVVLAGGAWSRLFLGNLGIAFPQATVVNSVMRSAPLEAGLERTCSAGRFSFRKRLDGGYTIAHRHMSVADIVPESFTQFFQFLPVLRLDRRGLRLRLGKSFLDALGRKRRWRLDKPTVFEEVRILDPEPVADILDEALQSLKNCFPAFADVKIVERWAGCIDATPDAVPVISPLNRFPGLFLASGFSGHGFGIGPGAGRLMADLVTGKPPVVDAWPFRYTRFFDGSNPKPTTGL
jgi:glycine/D-amino acid oxidase-like deaminating enzyme